MILVSCVFFVKTCTDAQHGLDACQKKMNCQPRTHDKFRNVSQYSGVDRKARSSGTRYEIVAKAIVGLPCDTQKNYTLNVTVRFIKQNLSYGIQNIASSITTASTELRRDHPK